jgi:hypothetical protein
MTPEREEEAPPEPVARDVVVGNLLRCTRCKLSYLPSKSTSSLRLTYCSFLCELGDLGFSMAGLENMTLKKKDVQDGEPQPVGVE